MESLVAAVDAATEGCLNDPRAWQAREAARRMSGASDRDFKALSVELRELMAELADERPKVAPGDGDGVVFDLEEARRRTERRRSS